MWELHYVKELIDFMSLELNNEIESFLMIGQSNIAGRGEFGEVDCGKTTEKNESNIS